MGTKHSLFAVLGFVLLAGLAWMVAAGAGPDARPAMVSWSDADEDPLTALEVPPRDMRAEGEDERVAVVTPAGEEIEEEIAAEDEERPLITVRGRVVDTFARPVASARVVLEVGRSSGRWRGLGNRSRVRTPVITGEDGRFSFEGPGFTESSISLLVTHESHSPHMADRTLDKGVTEIDVGDVLVPSGGVVIGTITDNDGVGIAGATAQLVPQREHRLRWVREQDELFPLVQVDRNGFFRLEHVAIGDYRIEAAAPLYERELSAPVTISEGEEEHLAPIKLGPGHRLTGIVVSPEGTGVAGAEVWFFASRGSDSDETTDEEGRFTFDHLRAGKSSVRVKADGFVTFHREDIDLQTSTELVVQLQRGLGVSGVVRDLRTGNPVETYAARIRRIGGLPDLSQNVDAGASFTALARSMESGASPEQMREMRRRFETVRREMSRGRGAGPGERPGRSGWRGDGGESFGESVERPGGRFSFVGMDEGVYEIDIDSPEHQRLTSEPIELRSGGTPQHLALTAEHGLSISGMVLSSADQGPVRGARVELVAIADQVDGEESQRRPSPMRMMFRRQVDRGPTVLTTETDRKGRFELRNAPPGRYAVLARASGHAEKMSAELQVRRDVDAVVLELGALARIGGVVVGVPPGREADTRVLAFGGPGNMSDVAIELDGSYVLEDLQPGSYMVRAFVGSMRSFIRSQMRDIFGAGEERIEFDVVLAEGDRQTFNPVLTLQPIGEVVGSVMVNGQPGAGLRISLQASDTPGGEQSSGGGRFRSWGREGNRARTNQDGEFTIPEVSEGEYLLIVESSEQRNELHRGPVSVLRDGRNEQRLSLQTVRLRGEVTAPDAEPDELTGSLRLYLGVQEEPADRREFAEDGRLYSVRVRDGAFEEAELAPGEYLLVLRVSGRQSVEQKISLVPGMDDLRLVAGAKH